MLVALQIRTNQLSISANLWPLIAYIYQVMIIVTGGFPKKTYFIIIFRSSRTQIFFKTGVVRSFEIVAEKRLCWSLFFFSLRYGLQLYFKPFPKETSTQVASAEWKLRNCYGLTACSFIWTSSQKRLQHRWLQENENCEIFMNSIFYRTPPVAAFVSLIK